MWALTRADKRDTLRDAVFFLIMPLVTPLNQFRLGDLKRPLSGGTITSINRHFDVFDSTPNPAAPISVTFGPTFILTEHAFLRNLY